MHMLLTSYSILNALANVHDDWFVIEETFSRTLNLLKIGACYMGIKSDFSPLL